MNETVEKRLKSVEEILSTFPRNNDKNMEKYLISVDAYKKEFTDLQDRVKVEIEKRFAKILGIKMNELILSRQIQLQEYEQNFKILNPHNGPYEKNLLDNLLYSLNHYYQNNLTAVHQIILKIIHKFEEVNIKLTYEDFNYSQYTKEYMRYFFAERDNLDSNTSNLATVFEQVYWHCPNIMKHLELNFKYLYYDKKKIFEKNIAKQKKEIMKKYGKELEEMFEDYKKVVIEVDELTNKDTYLLLQKFLKKEENTKDYTKEKIEKLYTQILREEIKEENKVVVIESLKKCEHSIQEYKEYLEFSYLIEAIKTIYHEKDKYKNVLKETWKTIKKEEKLLKKCNNKLERLLKKNRKLDNIELLSITVDNQIVKLKELYDFLDDASFNTRIITMLQDNSSLYQLLCLAYSSYHFFIKCTKEKFPDLSLEEIHEKRERLRRYILNPYHVLITNIAITEMKNLPLIISDRYSLLNFDITEEKLEEGNLDGILIMLHQLILSSNIDASLLSIEDIEFVCETQSLKEK